MLLYQDEGNCLWHRPNSPAVKAADSVSRAKYLGRVAAGYFIFTARPVRIDSFARAFDTSVETSPPTLH
jgi:hypothetical protein